MTFYQEHIVYEAGFGNQTVRIVVSDSVSDLYLQNASCDYNCDCISIETTKQSLSLSDNKFGIDELKFTINEAATKNNDGNKYVNAFLLEANDLNKSRFIAVFFNPVYTSTDNLIATSTFRGKVDSKITGQDLDWKNAIYSGTINPLREWKFTAYSIDYSLLEKIKLNERITKEDASTIQGIFSAPVSPETEYRISTAETDAIFKTRTAFKSKVIPGLVTATRYGSFQRLGSLYRALQLIFDKCGKDEGGGTYSGILNELYPAQNFTVSMVESSLTLKTQPTGYNLTQLDNYGNARYIPYIDIEGDGTAPQLFRANKKIQLTIKEGLDTETADDLESPIFIHSKMFNHELDNDNTVSWMYAAKSTEQLFNFRQCDNLLELLSEIARSLGCYYRLSLNGANNIQVEFVSRESLVDNTNLTVLDCADASLDISGVSFEGKPTIYYSLANGLANNGYDIIKSDKGDFNFSSAGISETNAWKIFEGKETEWFTKAKNERERLKDLKGIDYKRLLLTISQTLEKEYYRTYNTAGFTYAGQKNADNSWVLFNPINIRQNLIADGSFEYQPFPVRLHTGIYIRVTSANMAYDSNYDDYYDIADNIWATAFSVFIRQNTGTYGSPVWEEKEFTTLTDYINYLMSNDEQYYTQEYSLTVPYWNGFRKGANTNWKQLQLGSLIQLTWNVINYSGGVFTETAVTKTFVVNEIERDYQKVETKVKLHYEGRFAYSASTSAPVVEGEDTIPTPEINSGDIRVKTFIAADTIVTGDIVMVGEPLGVVKVSATIPLQDYYGRSIGVALNDADADENVNVQISGTAYCPAYDFTGYVGKYAYCRDKTVGTNMQGSTNVSLDCLATATLDENSVIVAGKIEDIHSFVLGIVEIPFADYPLPP